MPAKRLEDISISEIVPNRFQPRIHFDDEKIESLAKSIIRYGVLEPIIVRPVNGKYEIIAGERRYKASKIAGKLTIPSIIVDYDDKESIELALLENVQRQELTAIEEAIAYRRILDMGYITQEELAKKTGKSQPTIANKMRLLALDDETQEALINHKISERHARSLLKLAGTDKELEMLNRIIKERLTVRKTDEEIAILLGKKNKPVKETKPNIDDFLGNNYGSSKPASPKINFSEVESLFDTENLRKSQIKEEKGEEKTMDIEKIMQEAQDINASEEPKNMNEFITTPSPYDTIMGPSQTPAEPVENSNNVMEHNKFVTVMPQVEEEKEEVKPEYQEPSVTFDSVFNSSFSTPAPVTPVTNVPTPDLNLAEASPSVDEIAAGIQNIESILNSQPAQEPNLGVNSNEFNLNNTSEPTTIESSTYESQMAELNSNVPNINEQPVNNISNTTETNEEPTIPEVPINDSPILGAADSNLYENTNSLNLTQPAMDSVATVNEDVNNLNSTSEMPTVNPVEPNLGDTSNEISTPLASSPLDEIPEVSLDSIISSASAQEPILNTDIPAVVSDDSSLTVERETPVSTEIEAPINSGISDIPEFTSTIAESAPNMEVPETPTPVMDNQTSLETPVNLVSDIKIPQVEAPLTNNETQENLASVNPSITTPEYVAENSDINSETTTIPENNISDFAQVLEIIKNCKDQIEVLGYKVNMNEMDLSSIYQATFTIEKNN